MSVVRQDADPAKRHSAALTDGVDRAPARAMLKGVGFTTTTWRARSSASRRRGSRRCRATGISGCSRATSKQGIPDAGGTPLEFNTIAISDGVSMGTAGMRASLVSREVIADSIELVARGHLLDGLVCIVGCDKTIPAAVMALARLDLPGLVLYGGSIAPGRFRGRDVTIQDVFEAVGAAAAGTDDRRRRARARERRVPGRRRVRRPVHRQHDGDRRSTSSASALAGLNESRPRIRGSPRRPCAPGELAMKLVEDDRRPSQVLTREAFENAIAAIAATGGSTNGVLHLLAIAAEARHRAVDRRLRPHRGADADRRRHQARRPLRRDRPPRAGGVALVARELVKAGSCNGDAHERRRPVAREVADGVARASRAGGRRLVGPAAEADGRARDPARQPRARRLRREARRPRAALHRGPARVFESEEDCFAAVKARSIQPGDVVVIRYEGPAGGPGHARDAARDRRARRRRARRRDRADHRRPVLRRDPRADGRPRRTGGGPRRADRARARRRPDRARRRRARAASLDVPPTTSSRPRARRRGSAARRATRAACSPKYAASVGSASEGATDSREKQRDGGEMPVDSAEMPRLRGGVCPRPSRSGTCRALLRPARAGLRLGRTSRAVRRARRSRPGRTRSGGTKPCCPCRRPPTRRAVLASRRSSPRRGLADAVGVARCG